MKDPKIKKTKNNRLAQDQSKKRESAGSKEKEVLERKKKELSLNQRMRKFLNI